MTKIKYSDNTKCYEDVEILIIRTFLVGMQNNLAILLTLKMTLKSSGESYQAMKRYEDNLNAYY